MRAEPSIRGTRGDEPLTAVHVPSFASNPYQSCLSAALVESGIASRTASLSEYRSIVDGVRPDILHLHWLHPLFLDRSLWRTTARAVVTLRRLRRWQRRGSHLVWTVHNLASHERRFRGIETWLARRVAALSEAIIVHCAAAQEAIVDRFGPAVAGKVHVVPHGSYLDVYPATITSQEARRELGVGDRDIAFVFLGAVRRYKGLLELVASFARLPQEPPSRLVIAGWSFDRGLDEQLRRAAAGNARICFRPEYVPDDRVQVYMRAADVVVLPYQEVLTSGAAVLAMSFGKALIVPAFGCLGELLGESGAYLYRDGEGDGLTGAMLRALTEPQRLKDMGAVNLERAREWSWQRIAAMTKAVYEQVVAARALAR